MSTPQIIAIVGILAGLFGTLIGVSVSAWLSFDSRYDISRARLRVLLLSNGYDIWWAGSGRAPWEIIEANRVEIHGEYLTLRSLCLPWLGRRRSLDNAWANYTGVKHYRQLADYSPEKLFAKTAVSREEAIERTIGFIRAIT